MSTHAIPTPGAVSWPKSGIRSPGPVSGPTLKHRSVEESSADNGAPSEPTGTIVTFDTRTRYLAERALLAYDGIDRPAASDQAQQAQQAKSDILRKNHGKPWTRDTRRAIAHFEKAIDADRDARVRFAISKGLIPNPNGTQK